MAGPVHLVGYGKGEGFTFISFEYSQRTKVNSERIQKLYLTTKVKLYAFPDKHTSLSEFFSHTTYKLDNIYLFHNVFTRIINMLTNK